VKKRTQEQVEFDAAAHGWVFCSDAMLRKRLPQLRELAAKLAPKDPRRGVLEAIEGAAEGIPL
jgi:hypothetical protein